MDSDDSPIGRLLSRREVLALFGATGVALATGASFGKRERRGIVAALPPCVVRPAQTEGPYFVDERLARSDIRADPATGVLRDGAPLALTFLVSRVGPDRCEPLQGATVDVWHCDAEGLYSDVADGQFNTEGQKFLRGNQSTGQDGRAVFQTIYPGWYRGRSVHIHFKIRTPPGNGSGAEFTSQVYFDDAVTDRVYAAAPYNRRAGPRTRNAADRIFQRGGDQLMLVTRPVPGGHAATFEVGLDLG